MPAKWLTELVERDLKKGTRYWAAEGKLWSEENPDSYAGVHNHDGMMLIFDEASVSRTASGRSVRASLRNHTGSVLVRVLQPPA
jgi:hypothetical protein